MEMTLAKKANQIEHEIIASRGKKLFDQHGLETGKVIRAMAVSRAKQALAKEQPAEEQSSEEQPKKMNEDKLREMIKAALSEPMNEKKGKDMDGDGDIDSKDYMMVRDAAIKKTMQKEDLDLGHEDDEPHMIKGELYKIAQNAIALYKMLEPFDKLSQEVDTPAWWQAKITKACTMLGSARSYLEFELKEPQIDAEIDSIQEDTIDEKMTSPQKKKRGEIYDTLKAQGMSDEKAGKIATSKAMKKKIKEAILAKLKNK
jgi:hypothetical protein